jgi:ADP-ribose pyrophosphatase YjhB (NUDIX family)
MEDRWLHWAKRLQAIASTGLHFGASDYDKERYADVGEMAQQMLASLGEVPLTRIEELVPDYAQGYATPKIDVRGAVFEGDRVLLVRERTDGLWTLPGGYADVGLSAAENIEKEIREEASVEVKARQLYAVRHKAKYSYKPDTRDFYKFFFLCERLDEADPVAGAETMGAAFFGLDRLPELSTGRVLAADIEAAYLHRQDPRRFTAFD